MSNLITLKRSSVPSSVPAAADLELGELAVNTNDGSLFLKRNDNVVINLQDSDNIVEGSTNLFYTDARARASIAVNDLGGDGSLTYNSTSGVLTYNGISDAQIRSKFSATGDLSYNSSTGEFSYVAPTPNDIYALFSAAGDITYNSTTGEFSYTERTDAQIRGLISASGDINYNSTTGVISYSSPNSRNWLQKSAAYTAVANDAILADTSGGAFTITLPATPAANDSVTIVDAAQTFSTNNLTLDPGTNNIFGSVGVATLSTSVSRTLVYTGTTYGWAWV